MREEKRWTDEDFKNMILAEIQAAKQKAISDIKETNHEISLKEHEFYRNLKEMLESTCGFIKIQSAKEYVQYRQWGHLDDHISNETLHGIFLDSSTLEEAIRKKMDDYRAEIGRQYLPTAEDVQEKLDKLVEDIKEQRQEFTSMKWRFLIPFSAILGAGLVLLLFAAFLIRVAIS